MTHNILRSILVLVLAILPLLVEAQTGEILGVVVNRQHHPVAGALVEVSSGGMRRGIIETDSNGSYIINALQVGSDFEVRISAKGYITRIVKEVIVRNQKTTEINALLKMKKPGIRDTETIKYKEDEHPRGYIGNKCKTKSLQDETPQGRYLSGPNMRLFINYEDLIICERPSNTEFIVDYLLDVCDFIPCSRGIDVLEVNNLLTGLPAKYEDYDCRIYSQPLKPYISPEYLHRYSQ